MIPSCRVTDNDSTDAHRNIYGHSYTNHSISLIILKGPSEDNFLSLEKVIHSNENSQLQFNDGNLTNILIYCMSHSRIALAQDGNLKSDTT